ncbi:MAG: Rv3654c family TadE-like protein [Lawsonella sp.]|nr:hypothetical protein [Mycobacteriales bacterium]
MPAPRKTKRRIVWLRRNETGATTAWSAAAAGVLFLVLMVGMIVVGIVHTRHQAQNSADAAALAGAAELPHRAEHACQAAASALPHNTRIRMVDCQLKEHPQTRMPAIWVQVTVPFSRWEVGGKACAGPIPPH